MASGERKKGREQKKPKKAAGAKIASKSDYQSRQAEVVASPYFGKRK